MKVFHLSLSPVRGPPLLNILHTMTDSKMTRKVAKDSAALKICTLGSTSLGATEEEETIDKYIDYFFVGYYKKPKHKIVVEYTGFSFVLLCEVMFLDFLSFCCLWEPRLEEAVT